jgi:hypothetical protein
VQFLAVRGPRRNSIIDRTALNLEQSCAADKIPGIERAKSNFRDGRAALW